MSNIADNVIALQAAVTSLQAEVTALQTAVAAIPASNDAAALAAIADVKALLVPTTPAS